MENDHQTHTMTVGDRLTPLGVKLVQACDPVDLSESTVKFRMIDATTGDDKVTETENGVTITDADGGLVQYDFAAGDVDTAGIYYAWFTVYTNGRRDTYPPDGRKLRVTIVDA